MLPVPKQPEVFVEVETGSDSGLAVVSGLAIELETSEYIPCNGGAVISLAPPLTWPLLCSIFPRSSAPIRWIL